MNEVIEATVENKEQPVESLGNGDSEKSYPYIVIRLMGGVYQREDIDIDYGNINATIGYRKTKVRHPHPFDEDGSVSQDCRNLLAREVQRAVIRYGFRMCLVWSADDCTFCEIDTFKNSDDPPSGGIGTEGTTPMPTFNYDDPRRYIRMGAEAPSTVCVKGFSR